MSAHERGAANGAHDHVHDAAQPHQRRRAAPALARLRPFPARSLLGASLPGRLGVAALALALLWITVRWALR